MPSSGISPISDPIVPEVEPPLHLEGVALGLGLACFGAYQQFKLPVVLPVLLEQYGYDRTLAGAFMSIYALAGLVLSVWFSRIIARRGPLFLAAPAVACIGLGAALTLLAPHLGLVVLLARGVEGIAFAVLAIIGPVLASSSANRRQLPLVLGLSAAWIPVGQLSATVLAPISLTSIGWQGLWYVAVAGSVVFFIWCRRFTHRRAQAPTPEKTDAKRLPFSRGQTLALLLTAAIFMIWSGQYFAYMTWLPQYLVEVHGMNVNNALVGYVVPVVFVAIFNVVTGLMLRAGWPVGWVMVSALSTQVAVWWLIPFTGAGLAGVVSLVVYGIGAGIVPACLFALPTAILGPGRGVADAFGFIMTGRNLGVLIGPVLLAQTFKITGAWDVAAPLFGTLTTVCLGIAITLGVVLHKNPKVPRATRL